MSRQAGTRLSRNETEALCQKAARGAGMAWGLAEEAGFAAGWLAAHGVDGATALFRHLAQRPNRDWSAARASLVDGHWRAYTGHNLCPIVLGAALSDHAPLIIGPEGGQINTDQVERPVLLLPFLAAIAARQGSAAMLAWAGGQVRIGGDHSAFLKGAALLTLTNAAALSIQFPEVTGIEPFPLQTTPRVPSETIAGLDGFALRTTVPATETSRRGAGAIAGDND